MITEQDIKHWLQNYATVLSQLTIEPLREFYLIPCVLSTPNKTAVVTNETTLNEELTDIVIMLKQHKFNRLHISQCGYEMLNDAVTLVSTNWHFYDDLSHAFAEFSLVFTLVWQKGIFKIINVISHELTDTVILTNIVRID